MEGKSTTTSSTSSSSHFGSCSSRSRGSKLGGCEQETHKEGMTGPGVATGEGEAAGEEEGDVVRVLVGRYTVFCKSNGESCLWFGGC
jgi:hypothetical protein